MKNIKPIPYLGTDVSNFKKGSAQFYCAATQTGIIEGTEVGLFNGVISNDSNNISVIDATTCLLKAGRKYRITVSLSGSMVNPPVDDGWFRYGIYNKTASTYIGNRAICLMSTYGGVQVGGGFGGNNNARAIITTLVDTIICVKGISKAGSSFTITSESFSTISIEEMETYLVPSDPSKYVETVNFTSASGSQPIASGLPIGTKKLIRKLNSSQGTVTISITGETFTPSNLTSITLNSDGDFWLIEKVSNTRWDLIDGKESGSNGNGTWLKLHNGILNQYVNALIPLTYVALYGSIYAYTSTNIIAFPIPFYNTTISASFRGATNNLNWGVSTYIEPQSLSTYKLSHMAYNSGLSTATFIANINGAWY